MGEAGKDWNVFWDWDEIWIGRVLYLIGDDIKIWELLFLGDSTLSENILYWGELDWVRYSLLPDKFNGFNKGSDKGDLALFLGDEAIMILGLLT